jgi:hypothetical protein
VAINTKEDTNTTIISGGAKMMQFTMLSIHPDVPTYGAVQGEFTFIITRIKHKFHASVKRVGTKKFDNTRIDIGHFNHFQDASKACETYFWRHSQ